MLIHIYEIASTRFERQEPSRSLGRLILTKADESSFGERQADQIPVESLYDCHISWNPGRTLFVCAHSLRHNPME